MHKRTRVGLLPAPVFASIGLPVQAKNQHILAFIPIPSEARNLSRNDRAPEKADPFLRGSGQAQVLHFVQDKLRMTTWALFIPWGADSTPV